MRCHQYVLSLGLLFMVSGSVFAENNQNSSLILSHQQNTLATATQSPNIADKNSAAEWGLTEQEWSRYQEIKNGARGVWSPNLDPLTTLGIEATTDAERTKYARLLARKEFERVEKELRFQLAYDAAFKELYPGILPIRMDTPISVSPKNLTGERLYFFTQMEDCTKCESLLTKLLQNNQAIDIYVVDSQGNNDNIRHWAMKHQIPVDKVRAGHITLNHDNGLWFSQANGKMPALFKISAEGKWQAVPY